MPCISALFSLVSLLSLRPWSADSGFLGAVHKLRNVKEVGRVSYSAIKLYTWASKNVSRGEGFKNTKHALRDSWGLFR